MNFFLVNYFLVTDRHKQTGGLKMARCTPSSQNLPVGFKCGVCLLGVSVFLLLLTLSVLFCFFSEWHFLFHSSTLTSGSPLWYASNNSSIKLWSSFSENMHKAQSMLFRYLLCEKRKTTNHIWCGVKDKDQNSPIKWWGANFNLNFGYNRNFRRNLTLISRHMDAGSAIVSILSSSFYSRFSTRITNRIWPHWECAVNRMSSICMSVSGLSAENLFRMKHLAGLACGHKLDPIIQGKSSIEIQNATFYSSQI